MYKRIKKAVTYPNKQSEPKIYLFSLSLSHEETNSYFCLSEEITK